MRERGIPEGWSAKKSKAELGSPPQSSGTRAPQLPPGKDTPPVPQKRLRLGWLTSWVLWAILGSLVSGALGVTSVALLLKLPTVPNCPSIFWPMASASMRLYCAQVAANKQTVDDLLQAIALIKALPANHPMRQEMNGYLEQWSSDILGLGDEAFQAGKLKEAIAIAHKIPKNVLAGKLVKQRIESWQSTWSEAEGIYRSTEAEIRLQHWRQASLTAVRLLNINNNYWSTTKYEELNNSIETTQQDSNKLAKAQSLAKTGGLDNLLEAIKLAESIGSNSYIYSDGQEAIKEFGNKLLNLAQKTLDQRDADEAIAIANQIPESTNLKSQAQDFITLAEAWRSVFSGTIAGLQGAIAQAEKIGSDRPLYNKAQELVSRWSLEIQDVAHLDRARGLAQGGKVADLRSAITEAESIPDQNPLAPERDKQINHWRGQMETIEDRPYLDKAEQLASPGDINSLQAGINQANAIASGRALYPEAQSKIRTWTGKIQQIQDQPYLDQAEQIASYGDISSIQAAVNSANAIASGRSLYSEAQSKIRTWTQKIQQIQDQPYLDQARFLASSGNLTAAIATAKQIQPGRALSSEAQDLINDWQGQIRAQEHWQNARQIAVQGTPEALREAIRVADLVPTTSPLRTDVNDAINQWSHQMLSIAQYRRAYDLPGAIAIAKLIPANSNAYKAAQEQIEIWQKFLKPDSTKYNVQPSNITKPPESKNY